MFYLVDKTEDLAQKTASQRALWDRSKEVKEEPRYTGVFATKTRQSEHQKSTVN